METEVPQDNPQVGDYLLARLIESEASFFA